MDRQPFALFPRLIRSAKNEQTRIAAAKELLDRGYGKATQPLANDPENPLTLAARRFPKIVSPRPKGRARSTGADPSGGSVRFQLSSEPQPRPDRRPMPDPLTFRIDD